MSWLTIKTDLLNFSRAHQMIHSFGTGDPLAIGLENVINLTHPNREQIWYPLLFADSISSTINESAFDFRVDIYVMSRVEEIYHVENILTGETLSSTYRWQSIEDEVLDRMLLIAKDVVLFFRDNFNFDYLITGGIPMIRFVEARDDKVAGWKIEANFQFPFPVIGQGECDIPFGTNNPYTPPLPFNPEVPTPG
jgi:hypothetical protein